MKTKGLILGFLLLFCCAAACAETSQTDFLPEGSEAVWGERSYHSDSIIIEIESMRAYDSDVYVADIRVRSVEYFRRAFAGGEWSSVTQKISTIAEENEAILAMTGDSGQNFKVGWIVANGVIERDELNRKRDLCIIYADGRMHGYQGGAVTQEQLETEASSIWHAFLFGPLLLNANGTALTDFSESNVEAKNPRSALGYYEPGHYCFVQADGRSTESALEEDLRNHGMTLQELALFMQELGCAGAYNLDGGRSSAMWFNGEVISTQADSSRRIGDIMLIKEVGGED